MFNTIHVLLIDDDKEDFDLIQGFLDEIDHGKYDLTWKPTYAEGKVALQSGKFDVCLLDYRVGDQSGFEFVHEVRDHLTTIPIIFLTGMSDFEIDVRAMQVGAADYLVKSELTAHYLDRSIRYSIKNLLDMNELREMKAQILRADRMASLGMLASSLAHEIGTPLGVIRGRAELISKKQPAVATDSEVIIKQIDRISDLVKSLLRLARGEETEQVVNIPLKSALDDVLKLISPEIERKKIDLEVSVDPNLMVRAQQGPIQQIFLNLIVNSIQAIESARQNGSKDQHKIRLAAETKGRYAQLQVQDTGIGIETKNLSQLFRPFFTTKPIGEGTGLGLATSLKLAQSWGGNIEVSSEPNEGTCFTVQLLSSPQPSASQSSSVLSE